MVLEKLYPLELIERTPIYAFLLGLGYAFIGIGAAVLLFPEDPAIVGVAFISLMIYPTLNQMLLQEEEMESVNDEFHLHTFLIDHHNSFKVYTLLFLGVLLGFSFFALMLPSLATNHIFEDQINVLYGYGTAGKAVFSQGLFMNIFMNNLGVMILCFVTAFVFGEGGIFLIVWNASVWGTIFGNLAKTAAVSTLNNPFVYFSIVFATVFPHMILEAFSYVCAATAGGIISKGLLREEAFSERFNHILKNTIMFLVFALVVLVIAVTVETYVLGNAETYRRIIQESFTARAG
ncbi:MAG: stage II sporulation protein M [Nanoarchaeota archaeon]|nr:stage II sporulation protein M [Nanoarchaeota archaeon]